METFKLNIVSFNCKHYVNEGPKFEFINSLVADHNVILLQEHWLFDSQLAKLSKIGNGFCIEAKSSMNENVCRAGRPFGGCAVLWNPLMDCKVTVVKCISPRLCGVIIDVNDNSYLILNVYMPCDRGYEDNIALPEYIEVLQEISYLIDKYNTNFVIIGGDFNTNLLRQTPQTSHLLNFVYENDLHVVNNENNVPYTYVNTNTNRVYTSIIDHFVVSKNLTEYISDYSIVNNHLYSDHVPLSIKFNVVVKHFQVKEHVRVAQTSWKKATSSNIDNYKVLLDKRLKLICFDKSIFTCTEKFCKCHIESIKAVYNELIEACIYSADVCIPKTKSIAKSKCIPGWNDHIERFRQESLFWHRCWKSEGCPHEGDTASMMRITRARYHNIVKSVKKDSDNIRIEKMAKAISQSNHRNLWNEVRKIKGKSNFMSACVDGATEDTDICNIFADKYDKLYNSVPYDTNEMQNIVSEINHQVDMFSEIDYIVTVQDVKKAICKLKTGKSDGGEGLFSDHIIHGCHYLYVLLSMIFNAMLVHGEFPESMAMGTMVPIPKNKRKSLCNSDNYRSIALSSIVSKVLDWVILIKENKSLASSELQFGFKEGSSTTQCSFVLNETVCYYNLKHTNVYCTMLDASKAFDRVNYCKLFKLLLQRNISPLVLRLLVNMYTNQTLRVRWSNTVSSQFSVCNGVKQGGVLSPILFAIYTDGLLLNLEKSAVGCYMGNQYTGAIAYADDITLLCPSVDGMQKMLNICESYANQFDILFNSEKSVLSLFQGRDCKPVFSTLCINGSVLKYCTDTTHLGHAVSSEDKDASVKKAKCEFWKSFNIFLSDLGHLPPDIKTKLFQQYCCSFYGSQLWDLNSKRVNELCIAWRKALRILWKVPYMTHCNIIEGLAGFDPLFVQLQRRFLKFIKKCIVSKNIKIKTVTSIAIDNPMSRVSINYSTIHRTYGISNEIKYVNCVDQCSINLLYEVILIRDHYLQCGDFTLQEINDIISHICLS